MLTRYRGTWSGRFGTKSPGKKFSDVMYLCTNIRYERSKAEAEISLLCGSSVSAECTGRFEGYSFLGRQGDLKEERKENLQSS
jgi:hypothetical protein